MGGEVGLGPHHERAIGRWGHERQRAGDKLRKRRSSVDLIERGEQPMVYGDGSQCYDFIYVEDVARSNIDAMQSNATGRCYNVGRGIGTSIKELTDRLLALSNSDLGIQYEPAGLTFVTNRIGCPVAAKRDLGFQWSVDLDDGLQKLIEWRNQDRHAVLERQAALSILP